MAYPHGSIETTCYSPSDYRHLITGGLEEYDARMRNYFSAENMRSHDDGTARHSHPYIYKPYRPPSSTYAQPPYASEQHTQPSSPPQTYSQSERPQSSSGASAYSESVYSTSESEYQPHAPRAESPAPFMPKPSRKFTDFLGEQPPAEKKTWEKVVGGLKPSRRLKRKKDAGLSFTNAQ